MSDEPREATELDDVREAIRWLRAEDGVRPEREVQAVLKRALHPLLAAEGYDLTAGRHSVAPGLDFLAKSSSALASFTLGIEYKHFGRGRPIGTETVRQVRGLAAASGVDRAMLLGRFGFTMPARYEASQGGPHAIELLDLTDVVAWANRVEKSKPDSATRFQVLIRQVSHDFAAQVAKDPTMLDHLEWRDIERMMARVLEGLGFKVVLTPPSKDGGKDLILTYVATRHEESYIVELKHWRSGKRVGPRAVSKFFSVMIREARAGGLFLSTSGYATRAFEGLTELTRRRIRFGERRKIIVLAQQYMRAESGLWAPPKELPELLFEGTL